MEEMLELESSRIKVTDLLFQVRSMITAAGCADRIDPERWLMSWLDTPKGALGGVEPRCLLEKADNQALLR